jgi:transcriptional regulator with XRE-family HTH domain
MTANPGEPQTSATPTPQGRIPADTFAVRVLLSRHLAGLTVRDAAEQCGLNDATWSTWESGRLPRDYPGVCRAIADGLDVDFMWLMLGGPLEAPRGKPVAKRVKKIGSPIASRPFGPCVDRPKARVDQRTSMGQTGPGRRAVILTQTARS